MSFNEDAHTVRGNGSSSQTQVELDAHVRNGYGIAAQINHAFDIRGKVRETRERAISSGLLYVMTINAVFDSTGC